MPEWGKNSNGQTTNAEKNRVENYKRGKTVGGTPIKGKPIATSTTQKYVYNK